MSEDLHGRARVCSSSSRRELDRPRIGRGSGCCARDVDRGGGDGQLESRPGVVDGADVLLAAAVGRLDQRRVIPRYLTYTGSLTTPPCTGGVRWFLLPRIIGVDRASVRRLHALVASFPGYHGYPDNNRPVQPVGSRVVERRVAPSGSRP